jgi:hypothetical protein
MTLEQMKDKLMLDGKVYVNDKEYEDLKQLLEEKDIPFFYFPLFDNKNLVELDTKEIIKQLFGEERMPKRRRQDV